ncbi:MAG: AMP-binding protein [Bacteroidales bacterium]|nr:AMP-binding protein [Bacteroidales bacterium]
MLKIKSLNKQLERSFKKNWWRPALSNYKGETMNYAMLAERIGIIHTHYSRFGVKPGDKVAICGRNQANWGVAFLSAMTYGAVPVPLLHDFNPANIVDLLNHAEAKAFFVDEAIWDKLDHSKLPASLIGTLNLANFRVLDSVIPDLAAERSKIISEFHTKYASGMRPEDLDYYKDSPDELALINYTSGTSGFSKGVMIPYRALIANIEFAANEAEPQMDYTSDMVAMLPSAHMYGLMFEFLFEMCIGAHTHFLTKTPSPKVIMTAFQEIHPATIISVPLIIEKVYKNQIKPMVRRFRFFFDIPLIGRVLMRSVRKRVKNAFGGSFEEVILGGAAVNPEVERFFHKMGFPFTVGYGMTECAPIITYAHWNRCKVGSSGKAVAGCRIRIDSKDPEKIPGEIQVKGPNVFLGYYRNEEATAAAFTEDGWFRTGDMGVIRKGYLYLKGRLKCMILSANGQNIYPEELEAVINSVQYVVESLVVEEKGGLTAIIFPDYVSAAIDGIEAEELEGKLQSLLPEINEQLPNYAHIRKIELLKEDFERTPKRSIKRYLYLKNE